MISVFLSSYIVPNKNAEPVPFITFENEAGDETTKPLTETTAADWKAKVKSAEFRVGNQVVDFTGLFIYAPRKGDAIMMAFQENASFTTTMQKFSKAKEFSSGDRFIIDHIKIAGQEKVYAPIVYELK